MRIVSFIALRPLLAGSIEATATAVTLGQESKPPRAVAIPSIGMSKPGIYFSDALHFTPPSAAALVHRFRGFQISAATCWTAGDYCIA